MNGNVWVGGLFGLTLLTGMGLGVLVVAGFAAAGPLTWQKMIIWGGLTVALGSLSLAWWLGHNPEVREKELAGPFCGECGRAKPGALS